MFELLHTDARRRANLRQDLTAIVIAAGLLALCLLAVLRVDAPAAARSATPGAAPRPTASGGSGRSGTAEPPAGRRTRTTRGTPRASPSAASQPPAERGTARATPAPDAAPAPGASRTAAAPPRSGSGATGEPGESGELGASEPAPGGAPGAAERGVRHTIPPRVERNAAVSVEAWASDSALGRAARADSSGSDADAPASRPLPPGVIERTELALEPAGGERGTFDIQPLPPASAVPDEQTGATGESGAGGASGAPGDSGARGRWRVTARSEGTHRLRLVAVDVRDSAGRVDTTAWRSITTVDVPVAGDPRGGVAGALEQASRAASRAPARWIAACAVAFALGWLLRGARRERQPPSAPPEDPGVEYR